MLWRIVRRIAGRFGSFEIKTYLTRIPEDVNVLLTHGGVMEHVLKRALNLSDVFQYVRVRFQVYGRVTVLEIMSLVSTVTVEHYTTMT